MAENPYAAPKTYVQDAPTTLPDGAFVPGGRGVPAGNGWRWIAEGWAFTGLQRGTFIGVFLLLVVIGIVLNLIPRLGSMISALIMPVIMAGFFLGCDALRRGGQLEVGHLFAGFKGHAGKLLALGAIYLGSVALLAVIIMVIFGSAIGMMFLGGAQPSPEEMGAQLTTLLLATLVMLALSIPVYMAFLFAGPLVVLAQHDVVSALKTSFGACLKNILPFLIWGIALLFLSILATIPLALGWLLLGPVMLASIYLSYRDIFHEV